MTSISACYPNFVKVPLVNIMLYAKGIYVIITNNVKIIHVIEVMFCLLKVAKFYQN